MEGGGRYWDGVGGEEESPSVIFCSSCCVKVLW